MLKRSRPIGLERIRLPAGSRRSGVAFDFISDLHLRSMSDLAEFRDAVRLLGKPLLLMGGDYVESSELVEPFLRAVASPARTIIGVFGNNDLRFHRAFIEMGGVFGIRFLEDETAEWSGTRIFGIRQRRRSRDWLRDSYSEAALDRENPDIVLAHTPDALLALPDSADFAFLAGHVHGGQVRFEWLERWWTHTEIGRAHAEGISRRGSNRVFVGRGIGCSLMEIRNVPREFYSVEIEGEGTAREDAPLRPVAAS